jgi:hypothetical protein
MPARPLRRSTDEIDLTSEAIRRGVQYLAFRAVDLDLVAEYEPGPGSVNGLVARAAQAAVTTHQRLIPELEAAAPSPAPAPARSAAGAARRAFAGQLA